MINRHWMLLIALVGSTAGCRAAGHPAPAPPANVEAGVYSAPQGTRSPAPMEEAEARYENDEVALGGAESAVRDRRSVPKVQPGLGTEYGEQRHSSVVSRRFVRGSNSPDVTLTLRYNDWAGIRRAGGDHPSRSTNSAIATNDRALVLSLVDERGRVLQASDIGSQRYAIGEAGTRYQLGVENHSQFRYEVVASVDGLDVMDGDEAGFNKRGYILEPFSSLTIEGWRTSDDTVAAFRFGSIEDSYAERRGKGRNIGVVGAAFFHEEGGPSWEELQRRHHADPFPNRYAPPPPSPW